jgi:methylated-DNA-[protein]-cysteine S-methyltransferase
MESILMYLDYMDSPIGIIEIQASEQGITKLVFTDKKVETINSCDRLQQCKIQLKEYFAGTRKTFTLPLDQKGTNFQKSIWSALVDIPFGKTKSYGHIANAINNPKAVRAVGAANGKNPISIIVPCHRVIGSNGTLTGYAWGLERKAWLLKHEGVAF